jgi:hypothetical protein
LETAYKAALERTGTQSTRRKQGRGTKRR